MTAPIPPSLRGWPCWRIGAAGPGHVLLDENGEYRVEEADPDGYDYGVSVVTHYGSDWAAAMLR